MRKSICILSFSAIAQDARVLRQIRYLSPLYDLTVIGYGPPHKDFADSPKIRWMQLGNEAQQQIPNLITALGNHDFKNIRLWMRAVRKTRQFRDRCLSLAGKYSCRAQEEWCWHQRKYQDAWRLAADTGCDAYHANDWDMLPIAARSARKNRAAVLLDLHEYATLEYEEDPDWETKKRYITYILKKYLPRVSATSTVADLIAEKYKEEFGISPAVIRNAPEKLSHFPKMRKDSSIRLFHHGGASRKRHPELMIEAIARCDERYSLHFMFLHNEYVDELKKISAALAPGRVFFHDPVPPEEIVTEISKFDVGFYILPPTNFNNQFALPNKFLDFICAGLAVCTGPSPSMAEITRKYSLGMVCSSFDPWDMAAMLNQVSLTQWEEMRQAARAASDELNAQVEMTKLVDIYNSLL